MSLNFRVCLKILPGSFCVQSFLPIREPLVAAFSETRSPTSKEYAVEQGIVIPKV